MTDLLSIDLALTWNPAEASISNVRLGPTVESFVPTVNLDEDEGILQFSSSGQDAIDIPADTLFDAVLLDVTILSDVDEAALNIQESVTNPETSLTTTTNLGQQTGFVTLTPPPEDGSDDNDGLVTADDTDDPPTITNTTFETDENGTAVGNLDATDPEGETLAYSLSGTDAALFDVDDSGELTFLAAPDFEAPGDDDGDNVYEFTATVMDPGGNSDQESITVTVNDVDEQPSVGDGDFTVPENTTEVGNVDATDPEGEALTFTLDGPDAALFAIDDGGNLTFLAAPDFEAPGDQGGDNQYEFEVTAADPAGNESSAAVTVEVADVNEAPEVGSASFSVSEGTTEVGNLPATDPDGDSLTYSLSGPDAGSFSVTDDGDLAFTDTPSFSPPADADGDNRYEIRVTVSDGELEDSADVAVTLTEAAGSPGTGQLFLPRDLEAEVLEAVTVPVRFQLTDGGEAETVLSVDITISWNPSELAVANVRLADTIADFTPTLVLDEDAGTLIFNSSSVDGVEVAPGQTADFVLFDATPLAEGEITVNLLADLNASTTNVGAPDGFVPLEPAPTNGDGDTVDGLITAEEPVAPPVTPPLVDQDEVSNYAVGGGVGTTGAFLFDADGSDLGSFNPFPGTPGGTRVASADVTGDEVPDLIVGTGPGVPTQVVVIDGASGSVIASLSPFEETFLGGVFVAAGDVDGDDIADIAITPDEGGGPRARIFSGALGDQIADYFVIEDPAFRGGARVALADINNDQRADVLGAAGFLGGPRVAVWDGSRVAAGSTDSTAKFLPDFFVFESTLRNGVFIAGGDITGDGFGDLIFGAGPDGGPRVFAIDGAGVIDGEQTQVANFFAGDIENRGGIRVSGKDLDGDDNSEIVTASGTDALGRAIVYRGSSINPDGVPEVIREQAPFGDTTAGLFVG